MNTFSFGLERHGILVRILVVNILTKFQLPGKRPLGRFGNVHISLTGSLLHFLCVSNMHIKAQSILRFIKFYIYMFVNDNTIVNYFAKRALHLGLCCGALNINITVRGLTRGKMLISEFCTA